MKINKLRLSRYFMLANIIVLLTGLMISLFGYFMDEANVNLSSVLINIGSNIITVGVIAIMGRYLLIDQQDELLELINSLGDKIKQKSSQSFITLREIETHDPISEFIGRSNNLLLGGVALRRSVQPHRFLFLERIRNGAKLRFMLLNPDSPDVDSIAQMWGIEPQNIKVSIKDTLFELHFLKAEADKIQEGLIEVRLLDREPSFSFALSNPQSSTGVLRAGLRIYNHGAFTRPEWVLTPDDRWFKTFAESCEALWVSSEPYI